MKIKKMKIYNRESNGLKVQVWNDSNSDWAIQDKDRTKWYPRNKFTMAAAVECHCGIFGNK